MKLTNKIVLITGSSQGIGKEIAIALAKEKAKIIITYLEEKDKAKETARKCISMGAKEILILNLDIRKRESIQKAYNEVRKRFGKMDILINNAGVAISLPLTKQAEEKIENQLRTNLEGTVITTKIFLPIIKESIINIASRFAKLVCKNDTVYCASKWGLRGFTKALALEHPKLYIIAVNPGLTSTRMTNYTGVEPSKVASLIIKAIKKQRILSGEDLDIFKVL